MANKVKDNIFEHSQAKLTFYKDYLEKYLAILLLDKYTKEINIYDVFCGIGIYDDGNLGSPIIAIQIIQDLLIKHPSKQVNLIINDKDKSKVDSVYAHINKEYNSICKVQKYNLDALEMLQNIKAEIKKSAKSVKNLLFIDPYGYKEIYKNDIYDIMSSGNSEIILFLPIAQMYRFSNVAFSDEENNSYKHLRRFIKDFFAKDHPLLSGKLKNQINYINNIKEALSFDDEYYSASYHIQRDSKNFYALFFITNHIYGLDRIIDTKWKLDDTCGKGFQKQETKHLFSDDFEEESKDDCSKIFEELMVQFLDKKRTNNAIYEFTLKAGYQPKHASEVLKKLKKQNKLKFSGEKKPSYFYISWKYFKNDTIMYEVEINE